VALDEFRVLIQHDIVGSAKVPNCPLTMLQRQQMPILTEDFEEIKAIAVSDDRGRITLGPRAVKQKIQN